MLLLRHSADPFRRKNGQHAHIFNKVKRTDPKDQAELLEADEGSLGEFILDVGDVLFEFLGRVVVANGFLVNVTSASVIIHQSNSVIENGSNFLYLAALSAQHLYSSIHYDLRFLIGIEEGVEMVNDIWLTIFLRTFDLLLHIFSPNFFDLFLLNPLIRNHRPLSLLGQGEELSRRQGERSLVC